MDIAELGGHERGPPAELSSQEIPIKLDGVTQKSHWPMNLLYQVSWGDHHIRGEALKHVPAICLKEGGVDLLFLSIENRTDFIWAVEKIERQRLQRGDAGHRPIHGKGKALNRADSNPQSSKGAGPDRDGESLDLLKADPRIGEKTVDGGHESFGVGDGEVKGILSQDAIGINEPDAPENSGRVNSENLHAEV